MVFSNFKGVTVEVYYLPMLWLKLKYVSIDVPGTVAISLYVSLLIRQLHSSVNTLFIKQSQWKGSNEHVNPFPIDQLFQVVSMYSIKLLMNG